MTHIAVIAGSTRAGSFNRALARLAAARLAAHGAEVVEVDLATFDLPLYSAALEAEAFPPDALRLKQLFAAQDGLLFVSPEYNGSVPPLLKNAIDWASRPWGQNSFNHLPTAIIGASIGVIGAEGDRVPSTAGYCSCLSASAPSTTLNYLNAASPVSTCPSTSVCISTVPS